MAKYLALLFICCIIGLSYGLTNPPTCRIGFRMDNLQEAWLVDVQKAVMDLFIARGVPLSLGILNAHFGLGVDPTSTLTPYINSRLSVASQFEIVPAGDELVAFSSFNYTTQWGLLKKFQTDLYGPSSKLPGNTLPVISFIPTLNAFNLDTLDAMRNLSYTTLSAFRAVSQGSDAGVNFYDNCPASTGVVNQISHYPREAQVFDDNTHTLLSASAMLKQIESQLTTCAGYSVVVVDFKYFATNETSSGKLVPEKLSVLDLVLKDLKENSTCNLRLLRNMGLPYVTHAPTVAPTGAPTTATANPTKAATSDLGAPSPVPSPASSLNAATVTVLLAAISYSLFN